MIDEDLCLRAARLLSGEHRVEDLDRLFLGLRERHHGRACFREVGDFIAHRKERNKGLVTQVARDVFTSISVWSLGLRGQKPSAADIARAARANYRLASDAQLEQGCGLRRDIVKRRLDSGLSKFERGAKITDSEAEILGYLGNRFIWKPAFTDEELFGDFHYVLLKNGIIEEASEDALASAKTFLTLFAISCLHGTSIQFDDNTRGELLAGFANRERRLEVKVQIRFDDAPKPIFAPICMFMTSLQPEEHCDAPLLDLGSEWQAHVWPQPVEIKAGGRLGLVR
jgi:hypothetical protein